MAFVHDGKFVEGNGANVIFWRLESNGEVSVLIQKHPDRSAWELSGGGVGHDEPYIFARWDIFTCAAARETWQELGIKTDTQLYVWEAVFQQKIPIQQNPARFATASLHLYSYPFDTLGHSSDKLVLQPEEVSETRWMSLDQAILATQADPIDGVYLGRGYRLMLACFRSRNEVRRDSVRGTALMPWQGSFSKSVEYIIDGKTITI